MNLPTEQEVVGLLKKYAHNDELFDLVYTHGQIVAEIALWCADRLDQDVDKRLLEVICLLHDIGSYIFIQTTHEECYPQHAMFGSKLLEEEGLPPEVYQAVETHVLLGLTKQEIIERKLKLPFKDFLPQTIEARLVCYADRFHSKKPTLNSYDYLLSGFNKTLPKQAIKFKAWSAEFGIPNIPALAEKYHQPIR